VVVFGNLFIIFILPTRASATGVQWAAGFESGARLCCSIGDRGFSHMGLPKDSIYYFYLDFMSSRRCD
jgi:hypothetical protein